MAFGEGDHHLDIGLGEDGSSGVAWVDYGDGDWVDALGFGLLNAGFEVFLVETPLGFLVEEIVDAVTAEKSESGAV